MFVCTDDPLCHRCLLLTLPYLSYMLSAILQVPVSHFSQVAQSQLTEPPLKPCVNQEQRDEETEQERAAVNVTYGFRGMLSFVANN